MRSFLAMREEDAALIRRRDEKPWQEEEMREEGREGMGEIGAHDSHGSAQTGAKKDDGDDETSAGITSRTAPGVVFATREELADHYKSGWHRFNLIRITRGLDAVDEEEFKKLSDELQDAESSSGSESEYSEDDEEELRELLQAQREMGISQDDWEEDEEAERRWEKLSNIVPVDLPQNLAKEYGNQKLGIFRVLLPDVNIGELLIELRKRKIYKGDECLRHKTFQRYVIRAKAGTRQATRDAMGGSSVPKSAGSSLRRYNEQMLEKDISDLLSSWKQDLDDCLLIFVFAPGIVNRNSIFGCQVVRKDDPRIRHGPNTFLFAVAERPVLKEVDRVHHIIMVCIIMSLQEVSEVRRQVMVRKVRVKKAPPAPAAAVATRCKLAVKVSFLLSLGADPTQRDGSGKVPYELCKGKEERDAFRRFWASEPDKWDYSKSQIPSMLTIEMEEQQKQKAAEKKEKEKQRKKEQERRKKEQAKQKKEEEEKNRAVQEVKLSDRELRALAAERRLGVTSKHPEFECEMCKVKASSAPFERLGFKYCSTSCVVAHKLQLGK
ncbi:hypothetical protein GUITHDRAFT_143749 [Guillardia theta CCMP2712]|uniref:VLRF1 domain-containing protein n=1 Tax=Guillardia theta (strain CCMP2712) TaxID=905079 RepID=L1ITC2_GUITC|nr:hypothetical protein GUITHDRAFT_143749 [Guillardia theta CCMP2712]EKX39144.1 hypothetical protein GUITHDRAFT_143749 [Guillardia theta CCMP2712]|eukprot:XP_005826124.1 hypothetical protein GUITHDRAFT_143749 [Guillardia theta CCMP2712]